MLESTGKFRHLYFGNPMPNSECRKKYRILISCHDPRFLIATGSSSALLRAVGAEMESCRTHTASQSTAKDLCTCATVGIIGYRFSPGRVCGSSPTAKRAAGRGNLATRGASRLARMTLWLLPTLATRAFRYELNYSPNLLALHLCACAACARGFQKLKPSVLR